MEMSRLVMNRTLSQVAAIALALAVLLYFNPYTGIRHDAILYLGQALLVQFPREFSQDLFFAFGSQAQFTLFPRLLAALLEQYFSGDIFKWATLAGRLFFALACWTFVRAILPRGLRFPALLAVLVLPAGYGGHNIFKYGEAFLTARPFAEGLVLLSLAALVHRRFALFTAAIVAAALMHPLQALAGFAVAWLWLASADRRWLHLAWLAVPTGLLALAGIDPFSRLIARFDAEWFAAVADLNSHCLVLKWPIRDWLYWATDLYLLYRTYKSAVPVLSRVAGCAALALVLGTGASLILVDLLHLVLPTGLQLWRVQWIAHLLAMAALPVVVRHEFRDGTSGIAPALLLSAIALVGAPMGYGNVPWANALLIPLHAAWPALHTRVGSGVRRLVAAAAITAGLLHLLRYTLTQLMAFRNFDHRTDLFRIDVLLLSHPLVIGTLLLGGAIIWRRSRPPAQLALTIGLIALAGWAGSRWDFRSEWTRYIESSPFNSQLFGPRIEPGAQVYWAEHLLPTWLTLGRASYYNPGQQAGQMFNRETAVEATRRHRRMAPLGLQAAICSMVGQVDGTSDCFLSSFALSEACRPDGATRPPDYLVLPFRQPEPSIGEWVIPDSVRGGASAHYYLYRCEDLVASTGKPGEAVR